MRKRLLITAFIILFFSPASRALAQTESFFIDPSYDSFGRSKITAVLVKDDSKAHFYVDEKFWNDLQDKNSFEQALDGLSVEFENNIYPKLTSEFGSERNPGIDEDSKIFVLIHEMKSDFGGYFRSNDGYSKFEITDSNQKEIIYFNASHINNPLAKSFLSHEFMHLITFAQKEYANKTLEDVWLNEARAEYAPTFLGYNNESANYLNSRIQSFLENPTDSLTEWNNKKADYGAASLFIHYLADNYGVKVIADSLKSPETGIASIESALKENGFNETFSQIFANWAIAAFINDCNYGEKYCYKTSNFLNVHVSPKINFLPVSGESTLTFTDFTKKLAGNWYKIIGGKGVLEFKFSTGIDNEFLVPYITVNKSGNYNIGFLKISNGESEKLYFNNFGTDIYSLIILPLAIKEGSNPFQYFSWSVSTTQNSDDSEVITGLLARISELKKQISAVQAQIAAITKTNPPATACSVNGTLSYGTSGESVKCLQMFLKSQGSNIYPEGLITGYFGSLTRLAVIKFQEKYASDILKPFGLSAGTGYVGSATRAKIKELWQTGLDSVASSW